MLLLGYFKPKVNVVAQRFHFHKQLQGLGESVNAYMSALRQMVSACEFGEFLKSLRDQLVCGLACDKVQGQCLAATNLTLEKAFELASMMMEGAQEGLTWLQPTSAVPSSSTSELTVVSAEK